MLLHPAKRVSGGKSLSYGWTRLMDLVCADCDYGVGVTHDHVRCELLDRAFHFDSPCQVCRDGLLRRVKEQEPQLDLITSLEEQLDAEYLRLDEIRERLWAMQENDWETDLPEPVYSNDLTRELERDIGRAQRDLGHDLREAIRNLWPKTKGAENRRCPECGWARLDAGTLRCPIHKATLVAGQN